MKIVESDNLDASWKGRCPSIRHAISYAAQDVIVAADLVRNKQVSKRLMEHFEFLSKLAVSIPIETYGD